MTWDAWTQPPPEKKAKRLKLKKKDTEHHFAETDGDNSRFLSPSKGLESYQEPYCPKNTAVSTRWALKNFSDWTSSYNSRHPDAPCPEGILLSDDTKLLSFWLQVRENLRGTAGLSMQNTHRNMCCMFLKSIVGPE